LGLRQHSCKEKPKKEGGGLSKGERKRGGIFPSWDYLAQLLLDYTLERFKQTGFLFGQQRKIKGQLFFKKRRNQRDCEKPSEIYQFTNELTRIRSFSK
jgi:hypothetical protein